MIRLALAFALVTTPALACRHYTHWGYPWPQPRCFTRMVAQVEARKLPQRPVELEPKPDITVPLPSLDHMDFPPDCDVDWCDRLKGVGMLRDKFGTN